MNSIPHKKLEKLADRDYRSAYVDSQISVGVPFQIRSLRKQRAWSQEKLAEECGMLQPRISAIERVGRGRLNIDTLVRIAAAFDVALMIKFVPFSELAKWEQDFDPEGFSVASFENDAELHQCAAKADCDVVDAARIQGRLPNWNVVTMPHKPQQANETSARRPASSDCNVFKVTSPGVVNGR